MSVCHNSEYIMIFFLHVASNPAHWVSTDNCGPLGSSYMGLDSIRSISHRACASTSKPQFHGYAIIRTRASYAALVRLSFVFSMSVRYEYLCRTFLSQCKLN